jgi:uncharacterized protein (TIRG00374 family)
MKQTPALIKGVRFLLAVLLLLTISFFVDWKVILEAIGEISLVDIAVLLAISIALILVSVIKWRGFLSRLGIETSMWGLFRLYLVGYFVNLFMPTSLGGDVVRSLYVGSKEGKVNAFSATFLERYTGLIAMVLMALCALPVAPSITREIVALVVLTAGGVFVATWLIVSGALVSIIGRLGFSPRVLEICNRLDTALRWGVSDGRLLTRAALLSLLFHALTVANTMAIATAIGWHTASWTNLLVVVPLILLIGSVPLSPQGLGIQESVILFFLHAVGATTAQALAVALVLRAKSYLLAAIGGIIWFFIRREVGGGRSPDAGCPS